MLGILIASEQLSITNDEKPYFAGELSLDGNLRQIFWGSANEPGTAQIRSRLSFHYSTR
ncbi:MAG: hypothetical protein U9N81_10330 [Bacillota bacterium]|nr:hypothetical protein [Bacillota bacterium]